MSDRIHVLGLSPVEQYLLKLLLSNLFAGYLDKTLAEMPGMTEAATIDNKMIQTQTFFKRYTQMCDLLCPEGMLGRAKGKVLMIQPDMMKYVITAANGYDHHNNYLSPQQRTMLYGGFDRLNKKIVESYGFTYSKLEIEKAREGK